MNKPATTHFFNPYSDDPAPLRRLVISIQAFVLVAAVGITFLVPLQNVLLTLVGLLVVTMLLSFFGIVWPSQILTPLAIMAVSTVFMVEGNGIHDVAIVGLVSGIVVGGLFMGSWGLLGFGFLATLVSSGVGLAELMGYFVPTPPGVTLSQDIVIVAFLFAAIGLILWMLVNRLREMVQRARANEQLQSTSNQELLQLKEVLEKRVGERTEELEYRARRFESISIVARAIASIQDLDRLLPSIARVVSEQFGFYHIGIFLIDERAEYAILQAANSEGGQRMLKRGHRLGVGTTGIVGYAAGKGEPRVTLDVGTDAVYFKNPDLPTTRSEMAFPLKVGSRTIGVLDVQSEEIAAFKEQDIAVLGILADQISIAIENARLFSQTRQALLDSQAIYQQYVKQDWAQFSRTLAHNGYFYDGTKVEPLNGTPNEPAPETLTVPITIRGLTIGHVSVRSHNPLRQWSQEEINLVQAAAERAGLAIENFRLLLEARRRATKERVISEITSRIGSFVNLQDIMQTAVEELGRVMAGSEITLQLQSHEDN